MAMNQRQIDAAYDRLLELPPDVTDSWPESDEMDLADIQRQNQIDKEVLMVAAGMRP